MAAQRSGFSDLLAPGFYEIYIQGQDITQYPEEYSKIFMTKPSKRQYEEENMVTGFGSMPEKDERTNITYDDPILKDKKRYTHTTYALGFRVSEELWEDDLYNVVEQMPQELSFSGRDVVEVTAAGIFINGFTDTAANRGPDSEPLFGDGTTRDHPRKDGGRWSNQLSVPSDLNADSLELMLNLLADTVNDRGLLVQLRGRLLVTPTELGWTAKELLESELKPFVSTNEMNPFQDLDMKYFVWHYLTDPDAWFVLAQKHYLKFWWRLKSQFRNDDDFDTGDAKFKSRQRFSVGYLDGRGVVGTPGA